MEAIDFITHIPFPIPIDSLDHLHFLSLSLITSLFFPISSPFPLFDTIFSLTRFSSVGDVMPSHPHPPLCNNYHLGASVTHKKLQRAFSQYCQEASLHSDAAKLSRSC